MEIYNYNKTIWTLKNRLFQFLIRSQTSRPEETVTQVQVIGTQTWDFLIEQELTIGYFKGAQVGGRTWDIFYFSFIFSHNCSALDHSATAPPSKNWR